MHELMQQEDFHFELQAKGQSKGIFIEDKQEHYLLYTIKLKVSFLGTMLCS